MKKTNVTLWVVQVLLAALFLFAGVMKLILPIEAMTQQMDMPGAFLRFIGIAETLGGLGLVLPGLFRIAPRLTSLAAAGLVIIMIGASALSFSLGGVSAAIVPSVVCVLCAVVAYARASVVPHRDRRLLQA